MADAEFRITGVKEVVDNLSKLKTKVQQKIARAAVRKGANVWRDNARSNARRFDDPQTPNSIARNIVTQNASRLGKKNNGVAMRVGVLGGAKSPSQAAGESLGQLGGKGKGNPGGDTFYWRFHEFGTKHMAASPFMRPAQDVQAATRVVATELRKGIEKENLKT